MVTSPGPLSLPEPGTTVPAAQLLDRFLAYVQGTGLSLYPAQEEAILELWSDKHVILSTPTGSGKSLVALALCFKAASEGKRAFYTCPIKALVNEKFFSLCDAFGAEQVGLLTGDASINPGAKVVCCTAEILANRVLRQGSAGIDAVVMDEFHFYGDRERGMAWQAPLVGAPNATFLLMSATLGDTQAIEKGLTELTGREVAVVKSAVRPVPLEFEYRQTPLHETIDHLLGRSRAPIYLVSFTQRGAAEQAQNLMSVNVCSKEEKEAIRQVLLDFRFDTPYGKELDRHLRHGIGIHHAGLLPKYRRSVERLAQMGLLKVISGTDTLGVGVNVPIRTVLLTQLCKFDGQKTRLLSAREFHQIAGRAGRKGFDDRGWVVVQAPEHVIENLRLSEKEAAGRKVVKQKPPTKGYVHWDQSTFDRLISQAPEPLEPSFQVTHGVLLAVLQSEQEPGGRGYRRLIELIGRSHGRDHDRRVRMVAAARAFRVLRAAGLIEVLPAKGGAYVQVSPDLQKDFSLHHTLALYLIAAIEGLEPASPSYPLDLLSLVESILENPDPVLYAQLDRIKQQTLAELKAQGVDYEDRIAKLEELTWPKPLSEYIYPTFNEFAKKHPWVGEENIRPKSVAREIVESLVTFNGYVSDYGLSRSEGTLLRYLSQVYKALVQTVPESRKNEQVEDIPLFLRRMIEEVDESLLEEWEELKDPLAIRRERHATREPPPPKRIDTDPKAFRAFVRTELWRLVLALAKKRYAEAASLLDPRDEWTEDKLAAQMAPFWAEHAAIDLTPRARRPDHTFIRSVGGGQYELRQAILPAKAEAASDPEPSAEEELGSDWMIDAWLEVGPPADSGPGRIRLRGIRS